VWILFYWPTIVNHFLSLDISGKNGLCLRRKAMSYRAFFGFTREPFTPNIDHDSILQTPERLADNPINVIWPEHGNTACLHQNI
jgi:hypothetical protein